MADYGDIADIVEILLRMKASWDRLHRAIADASQCASTLGDVLKMFGKFHNDKYAHCLASCKISKDCSLRLAIELGAAKEFRDMLFGYFQGRVDSVSFIPREWKEWLDENIQGGTPIDSLLDFLANINGYSCRGSPLGCEKCCNCIEGGPWKLQ